MAEERGRESFKQRVCSILCSRTSEHRMEKTGRIGWTGKKTAAILDNGEREQG